MKIREIRERIRELKKAYKKIVTNFYPGVLHDEQEADLFDDELAIVFVVQESNRKRAFFAFADQASLIGLLLKIPTGTMMEYIYSERENPLETMFLDGEMVRYSSYIRITTCYSDNPYLFPETRQQKLLAHMYDPNCGEYAQEADADQLYRMTKETFDPLCDDVFSREDWQRIIRNKECILYREEGEIIAYYVYRVEGNKVYSNMSVNRGAANYLYNIERRIFEKMWDAGIRTFYCWINQKNSKSLKHMRNNNKTYIKSRQKIFNYIYIKHNNQEESQ